MKLILLLIPLISFASLKIKDGKVLPLVLENYPLERFVEDYAIGFKKTILTSKIVSKSKKKINLSLSQPVTLDDFEKMFITVLESRGLAVVAEKSFMRIIETRDVRYTPSDFYTSKNYPKDNSFVLVVHQLRNPLSNEISRNMRPFMSRYGRIISFNDSHTIVISDKGVNISKIFEIVDSLDNKETLDKLINKKSKKNKKNPLSRKENIELEEEKLKIEKELITRKIEHLKNNKGER